MSIITIDVCIPQLKQYDKLATDVSNAGETQQCPKCLQSL